MWLEIALFLIQPLINARCRADLSVQVKENPYTPPIGCCELRFIRGIGMLGGSVILASKAVTGASLFLTVLAGVIDVRRYIIPNWISFAVLVCGLVFGLLTDGFSWLDHLGAGLLTFFVGLIFFSLRLFGGGDVKLLTALAFWAGFGELMDFVFLVAVAGGFLSLIYLLRAVWLKRGRSAGEILKEPVPYGVAITVGGVYLFLRFMGQLG